MFAMIVTLSRHCQRVHYQRGMEKDNEVLKIKVLIPAMIMLLSGCSSGSAGEELQDDSLSNGKVRIIR